MVDETSRPRKMIDGEGQDSEQMMQRSLEPGHCFPSSRRDNSSSRRLSQHLRNTRNIWDSNDCDGSLADNDDDGGNDTIDDVSAISVDDSESPWSQGGSTVEYGAVSPLFPPPPPLPSHETMASGGRNGPNETKWSQTYPPAPKRIDSKSPSVPRASSSGYGDFKGARGILLRPKTSRHIPHPSPDAFTDYVVRSAPTPRRNGPGDDWKTEVPDIKVLRLEREDDISTTGILVDDGSTDGSSHNDHEINRNDQQGISDYHHPHLPYPHDHRDYRYHQCCFHRHCSEADNIKTAAAVNRDDDGIIIPNGLLDNSPSDGNNHNGQNFFNGHHHLHHHHQGWFHHLWSEADNGNTAEGNVPGDLILNGCYDIGNCYYDYSDNTNDQRDLKSHRVPPSLRYRETSGEDAVFNHDAAAAADDGVIFPTDLLHSTYGRRQHAHHSYDGRCHNDNTYDVSGHSGHPHEGGCNNDHSPNSCYHNDHSCEVSRHKGHSCNVSRQKDNSFEDRHHNDHSYNGKNHNDSSHDRRYHNDHESDGNPHQKSSDFHSRRRRRFKHRCEHHHVTTNSKDSGFIRDREYRYDSHTGRGGRSAGTCSDSCSQGDGGGGGGGRGGGGGWDGKVREADLMAGLGLLAQTLEYTQLHNSLSTNVYCPRREHHPRREQQPKKNESFSGLSHARGPECSREQSSQGTDRGEVPVAVPGTILGCTIRSNSERDSTLNECGMATECGVEAVGRTRWMRGMEREIFPGAIPGTVHGFTSNGLVFPLNEQGIATERGVGVERTRWIRGREREAVHGTVPGTTLESTSYARGYSLNKQGMATGQGEGVGRTRWVRGMEQDSVLGIVPGTVAGSTSNGRGFPLNEQEVAAAGGIGMVGAGLVRRTEQGIVPGMIPGKVLGRVVPFLEEQERERCEWGEGGKEGVDGEPKNHGQEETGYDPETKLTWSRSETSS